MVVFKGNNIVKGINHWLVDFKQIVDKAAENQHLQFTAEIWTNYTKLPPSVNKFKVQTMANDKSPLLYMKISWYNEGGA